MDRYDVTIKSKYDDHKWTMVWSADSFADAESKTIDALIKTKVDHYNEIIKIEKEYE